MPSNDGQYAVSIQKPQPAHTLLTSAALRQHTHTAALLDSNRAVRSPTWEGFYKTDPPKEVIVIEDSPERPVKAKAVPDSSALVRNVGVQTRKRKRDELDRAAAIVSGNGIVPAGPTATAKVVIPHQEKSPCVERKRRRTRQSLGGLQPTPQPTSQDTDSIRIDQASTTPPLYPDYKPPKLPAQKVCKTNIRLTSSQIPPNLYHVLDDKDGHYTPPDGGQISKDYTSMGLLGSGTFGKVMDAEGPGNSRVAVKIIRAVQKYRDAAQTELRVMKTIQKHDPHKIYKCLQPVDCFEFQNHICIVTERMDLSVFDFLKANDFVPFPNSHIQSIAHQLLTSVAFLHDIKLVHTDLKPENILFKHAAYQNFTYNRQVPFSNTLNYRTASRRRVLIDPEIRLIDFGSATFEDEYHSTTVSTRHYRAPEVILGVEWSYPCDIWSIACILIELYTGDALFQTHDNREHLAMIEAVLDRNMDSDLVKRMSTSLRAIKLGTKRYFGRNGLEYPRPDTSVKELKYLLEMRKLTDIVPPVSNFLIGFYDLLRRMLECDPAKRITAKEALDHPWFLEPSIDDGSQVKKLIAENKMIPHGGWCPRSELV